MSVKKYYFTVLIFFFSALVISFIIIPSNKDAALMYFDNKQYVYAESQYQKIIDEGDESISTVLPMVWLKLQDADEEEAIKILEEFLEEQPESVEAYKYLGKLYLSSGRYYDYLQSLENMYALSPDRETLREMSIIYEYFEDSDNLVRVLDTLIEGDDPQESDFTKLAYYYASKGQMDKAAQTLLQMFISLNLEEISLPSIEFLVDLLTRQNNDEVAFVAANRYISENQSVVGAVNLAYMFYNQQLYREGLELLDLLDSKEQEETLVIRSRVDLMFANGLKKEAYQMIKERFENETLPDSLYSIFVFQAVGEENLSDMMEILSKVDLNQFPRVTIRMILERAIRDNEPSLAMKVAEKMKPEFFNRYPEYSLGVIIGSLHLNADEELFFYEFYQKQAEDNPQIVNQARIWSSKHNMQFTKALIEKIQDFEGISANEIYDLTSLYISVGMASKAVSLLDTISGLSSYEKSQVSHANLILQTALGNTHFVVNYLNKETVNEALYQDVFRVALDQKQSEIAVLVGESIIKRFPLKKYERFLAQAYLANGNYEQGIALFKKLINQGQDVMDVYIYALTEIADLNPKYQEELKTQVLTQLNNRSLPLKLRRMYGYILINMGEKEIASQVFFGLAEHKSFDEDDTQALLSTLGAQIGASQLHWIEDKVVNSEEDEKGKWLTYLVYMNHPEKVVGNVEKEELMHDAIANAYLKSLIALKQDEEFADAISYVIPQESRIDRLKEFGKLSTQQRLDSITERVYQRALTVDPSDLEVLMALGTLNFSRGNRTQAKYYLWQYIEGSGTEYLGFFYYGELLLQEERYRRAKDYYMIALSMIYDLEEKNLQDRTVLAQLMNRLRNTKKAICMLEGLLEENPSNLFLRADLVNLLLDNNKTDRARCVLSDSAFEGKEGVMNLELARMRYYKDVNKLGKAFCIAQELNEQYPDSVQVASAISDLNFYIGKLRKAIAFVDQARYEQPENQNLYDLQWDMLLNYTPSLRVSQEYRVTEMIQDEYLGVFYFDKLISNWTKFIVRAEYDKIEVESYANINDPLDISKKDELKYRVEAAVRRDFCNGSIFTGSLFLGEGGFGGGVTYNRPDRQGYLSVVAEYNRPNWDFTQTIIDNGSKDMSGFTRLYRVTNHLNFRFGGSYNWYNLEGFSQAASSYSYKGGFSYLFPANHPFTRLLGYQGRAVFEYGIDAERELTARTRTYPIIGSYVPLSVGQRETHYVTLLGRKQFSPVLAAEGYGGYSYDTCIGGACVPIYGLNVFVENGKRFEANFLFSHVTSTIAASSSVERCRLEFKYRY